MKGLIQRGHEISLIGWDDSRRAYLALNSWGSWGGTKSRYDGTFWISYDDINVETQVTGIINTSDKKIDISNAQISLGTTSYNWDGQAKEPGIRSISYLNESLTGIRSDKSDATRDRKIRYSDSGVIEGRDYEYSYENNVNVGQGKVIITGKGRFTGTLTKTFEIKSISMTTNVSGWSGVYDRAAHGITVKVTKPSSGATIRYGTESGKCTMKASPTFTDVGKHTIFYEITANGYTTVKGSQTVNITKKDLNATTVTLTQASYTYDGTPKLPEVSVVDGGVTLEKGKDYNVNYSNNTNVGKATAQITGTGNYTGTVSKEYTINPATLVFNAQGYSGVYDRGAHGITVNVTKPASGATVKYGTAKGAYTSKASPTYEKAGTYTVFYQITAEGYKIVEESQTVNIEKKSLNTVTITLDITSYVYDGTPKLPEVSVTDGSITLVKGQDYNVNYSNNTNVGKATAQITGIGNYTDTVSKEYTITPATIVLNTEGYSGVYDRTAHGITVNVTKPASGATVKYGTEKGAYTLNASPMYENAGTYMVFYQVTAEGYNAMEGSQTVNITKKSLDSDGVTLKQESFRYDGTEKELEVVVVDGEVTLVKDQDYNVAYDNNINVGTATATITGIGNYSGTISKEYTINSTDMVVDTEEYDGIYDREAHGIIVSVIEPSNGATIKYGTEEGNYTLEASPTYENVGTYTVYYEITANNYNNFTGSETITITPKSIESTTINFSEDNYVYDGNEKKPTISVLDEDVELELDKDYAVTYNDNINAGTATVIITGKENYTSNATKTFEIDKGMPNYTVPSGIPSVYGMTLADVHLPENFEWEDSLTTPVGEIGENTFKCRYIPTDTQNYNIVTGIGVTIIVYDKLDIEFNDYVTKQVNNTYYIEISSSQILKNIEENIHTNGTMKIYNGEGEEVTSENEIIKTGMKIEIETEVEKAEYVIVCIGDVSGDGQVNSIDLLKLARYIVEIDKNLNGPFLLAGNIYKKDNTDTINNADLLKLARVLVGLDEL